MKKIIALLMVAVMCISFASCSTQGSAQPSGGNAETQGFNLELLQFFCTEWEYDGKDASELPFTKIDIKKDGTCVVDGKPGIWEMYERPEGGGAWSAKILVDEQYVGSAEIYISSGRYNFILYYGDGNVTDEWKCDSKKIAEEKDIVLTAENFSNYFEVVTEANYRENEFDEVESVSITQYVVLKEEYAAKFLATDAVLELKCKGSVYPITLSATEKNYTLGEATGTFENQPNMDYLFFNEDAGRCQFTVTGMYLMVEYNTDPDGMHHKDIQLVDSIEDIEVVRVKGNIYLKDE